jgi:DNA-binding NarL/FixJ family response regulator
MNVSDTMNSIRWLFEKHLGKYESSSDLPIGRVTVAERKDSVKGATVNSEFTIEALRRYSRGEQIKSIAQALGSNETTVGNVVRRKKSYSNLPHTKKAIIAYFKERNRT